MRGGQALGLLGRLLDQPEREPLRRLRADAGQPRQLVDQLLDRALVHGQAPSSGWAPSISCTRANASASSVGASSSSTGSTCATASPPRDSRTTQTIDRRDAEQLLQRLPQRVVAALDLLDRVLERRRERELQRRAVERGRRDAFHQRAEHRLVALPEVLDQARPRSGATSRRRRWRRRPRGAPAAACPRPHPGSRPAPPLPQRRAPSHARDHRFGDHGHRFGFDHRRLDHRRGSRRGMRDGRRARAGSDVCQTLQALEPPHHTRRAWGRSRVSRRARARARG